MIAMLHDALTARCAMQRDARCSTMRDAPRYYTVGVAENYIIQEQKMSDHGKHAARCCRSLACVDGNFLNFLIG